MSNSIDERLVRMEFDNAQFESKVHTTMGTLDQLNNKLQFSDSSKGLENISKTANTMNFDGLSSAVEALQNRFSVLGDFVHGKLMGILDDAWNFGTNLTKAVTIDPIKSGFTEYETQMGAVQTILANTSNKGSTLDDVNNALNTLNTYADKTIYNFTEMTRNIGTFTAAGVDLQTSVDSIQGIANLAAVSGSTSMQASTAMYQLSQAIAAGSVKLMDWNSVVQAGMGGEVFRNALIRTSENLQTGAKAAIEAKGSFQQSLATGWLTTEVLTETLKQFSLSVDSAADYNKAIESLVSQGYTEEEAKAIADMAKTAGDAATKVKTFSQLIDTLGEALGSGWTQSFQYILGDFEQSKELFTGISDVLSGFINDAANARNAMLAIWESMGGRAKLIEGLSNVFFSLLLVVKPIKEAFDEIFPPATAARLLTLTYRFKEFTEKLVISEETADKIKRVFKGVFSVFNVLKTAIKGVLTVLSPFTKLFGSASSTLLDFAAAIGDYVTSVSNAFAESQLFKNIASFIDANLIPALQNGIQFISDFVSSVHDFLSEHFELKPIDGIEDFIQKLNALPNPIKVVLNLVKVAKEKIAEALTAIGPALSGIAKTLSGGVASAIKGIGNALSNVDFSTFASALTGMFSVAIIVKIKKFFTDLTKAFKKENAISSFIDSIKNIAESAGKIKDAVCDVLDGVKDSLEAFQNSLKAKTLLTIAAAIGILALALSALSNLSVGQLAVALTGITGLFTDLFISLGAFEKIVGSSNLKGLTKLASALLIVAVAVGVLAGAVKKLSSLSWEDLIKGIGGVAVLTTLMSSTAKKLSGESGKLVKGIGGLILFAAAIKILTSAVAKLGELPFENLAKGLIGVGVLIAAISKFLSATNGAAMKISTGVGLIALAAALRILAGVVNTIGSLDLTVIAKGLVSIEVLLLEISSFLNNSNDAKGVITKAAGLVILASAMNKFAAVVTVLGNLPLGQIAKGLGSMGVMLFELSTALNALPKNTLTSAAGLVVMSYAIKNVADSVAQFGKMKFGELAKGLIAMAVGLGVLVVALNSANGGLIGAAALVVVAAAVNVLVPALQALSKMSLGQLFTALAGLAGAFTILGVAAVVLTPLSPVLLILAATLGIIGAAMVAAGAGITLFSTGLAALAVSGVAGATALGEILKIFTGYITTIGELIGTLVVTIAQVLGENAPVLIQALTSLISSGLTAIQTLAPQFIETVLSVLTQLMNSLATYIPQVAEYGLQLITGIMESIRDHIGEMVQLGIDIVVKFVNGVASKLSDIIQAGINFALSLVNGIADGIRNNTEATIAAVDNLMNAVIGALFAWVSHFAEKGIEFIVSLGEGILTGVKSIPGVVGEVVQSAVDALSNLKNDFFEAAGNAISGFIEGLWDGIKSVGEAAKNLGKSALDAIKGILDINSPSKETMKLGNFTSYGLAKGILDKKSAVEKSSKTVGASITDSLSEVADSAKNTGNSIIQGLGMTTYLERYGKDTKDYSETVTKSLNSTTASTEKSTTATKANTSAVKASTTASKEQSKATSKSSQNIEQNAKFLKYAAQTVKAYTKQYGQLNSTLGDTAGIVSATEAITLLATRVYESEQAYTQTITTAEEAQTRIDDIKKSFVSLYESIQSSIESAIKINEEFDYKFGTTSKSMLSNIDSQIIGFQDYSKALQEMVQRGFDADAVREYAKSNVSSIGEMSALLMMSRTEIEKWNSDYRAVADIKQNGAAELLSTVANALVRANVDVEKSSKDAHDAIKQYIQDGTYTIKDAAGEVQSEFKDTSTYIVDSASDAANAYGDMAKEAYKVYDANGDVVQSFVKIGDASTEQSHVVETAYKAMQQSIEDTLESQRKFFEEFDTGEDDEDAKTADDYLDMMQSQIDGTRKWGEMLENISNTLGDATGAKDFVEYLTSLGPESYKIVSAFNDASEEQLESAVHRYKEIMSLAGTESDQIAGTFRQNGYYSVDEWSTAVIAGAQAAEPQITVTADAAGENFGLGYVNGMASTLQQAKDQASTMGYESLNSLQTALQEHSPSKATEEMGVNLGAGLQNGMSSSTVGCLNAAQLLARTVLVRFQMDLDKQNFVNIGKNIGEGLIKGMSDSSIMSKLINTASDLAKSAYDAAREALDINSPSRKFRSLGKSAVEGFAQGFDRYSKLSTRAAETVSNDALSAVSDIVAAMNIAADDNFDIQPTITPVVDMSNVSAAGGLLNGYFGQVPMNVSSYLNSFMMSDALAAISQNAAGSSDVVSAIRELRSDVQYLGQAIGQAKVTLDTGVIAGAVTPGVSARINSQVNSRGSVWK